MGTKFTVYDSGLNPMKTTGSLEDSNMRQELAAICYVSSICLIFLSFRGTVGSFQVPFSSSILFENVSRQLQWYSVENRAMPMKTEHIFYKVPTGE